MKKDLNIQELRTFVATAKTMTDVIVYLGYSDRGGKTRAGIKRQLAALDISTEHFTRKGRKPRRWTVAEMLVENSPITNQGGHGNNVLEKAMREAYGYSCVMCGNNGVWQDKPLRLHKDHINGNNRDNRIENLRFLCPNCHQQTTTWGKAGNKVREVSK